MEFGLRNQVVLVTGSSSGIGQAAAVAFAREGAKVAVTYHSNRDGAETTAAHVKAAGGEALIVPYDLADTDSIRASVKAVQEQWGALHVLVNNAVGKNIGLRREPFENVPPEHWQSVINTALEGTYLTIQAALPLMRQSGWGRIVNISSDAAIHGHPSLAPYATAKAGLDGLTRTLGVELAPANILTNIVMPGFVATESNLKIPQENQEMIRKMTPTGRFTTPEDVAQLIVFLGSQANGHVNGQTVLISGGGR
jgi:3-oxoacyl-[acyl-carrier protein] reductase